MSKTTRRQVDALREQRTLGESLRDWREQRRDAALKRRKKRRKVVKGRKRGVDRAPDSQRLRVHPEPLVTHEHPPYRARRAVHKTYGITMPKGENQPHRNPDKDRRLAGKARRNMRRSSLMVLHSDGTVQTAAEYLAGRR